METHIRLHTGQSWFRLEVTSVCCVTAACWTPPAAGLYFVWMMLTVFEISSASGGNYLYRVARRVLFYDQCAWEQRQCIRALGKEKATLLEARDISITWSQVWDLPQCLNIQKSNGAAKRSTTELILLDCMPHTECNNVWCCSAITWSHHQKRRHSPC